MYLTSEEFNLIYLFIFHSICHSKIEITNTSDIHVGKVEEEVAANYS